MDARTSARAASIALFSFVVIVLPQLASATTCGFGSDIGNGQCRGYLTSGSSWTVPPDWNNDANAIEAIGGGGGGGAVGPRGSYGGGGGAYSAITNLALTPGSAVGLSVGAGGGTGTSGGDTWFASPSIVLAKGGVGGGGRYYGPFGYGGSASAGVGAIRYSGGSSSTAGGGGGAAGPHGDGNDDDFSTSNGGAGDAGYGGGGGSHGGFLYGGTGGGNGNEWSGGVGSGGGGGGTWYSTTQGGNGGYYGGGGGGNFTSNPSTAGYGAPGLIVITYTSLPPNNPPATPTISGPTSGLVNTAYAYTFTTTDANGDSIRYGVDWNNDGVIDEWVPATGYVASGMNGQTSHAWISAGTYTFEALAQDVNGANSSWQSYSVTIANPTPVVLLTASSNSYTQGSPPITLQWSSSYTTSCSGTTFSTGTGSPTSGTASVTPTQTTTYTVTCAGAGGSSSSSQTVTYTCTPTYTCTNVTTVHSSCPAPSGTNTSCGAGLICSPGSAACVTPPSPAATAFADTSGGNHSGNLEAHPALIGKGRPVKLFWNIANVSSCTVSGSLAGSGSWTEAYAGQNGTSTPTILQQTIYTLRCTGLDGSTFVENATVNIIPLFNEL